MSLKPLFLFACTLCALPLMAQKNYTLTSPDGTLQATVATGSDLRISLSADGETLLAPSPVSMTLGGGEVLGSNPKVTMEIQRLSWMDAGQPRMVSWSSRKKSSCLPAR